MPRRAGQSSGHWGFALSGTWFYLLPGSAAFYGVILDAEQLHGNLAGLENWFEGDKIYDDKFEVIGNTDMDSALLKHRVSLVDEHFAVEERTEGAFTL